MRASSPLPRAMRAAPLAAALLGACTVGPNYHRPSLPTPPGYAEAGNTPRTAVRPIDADLSAWWTQFPDPELRDLVRRALASNLDLAAAASRVRQARWQERVAGAAEYPSIAANASAVTVNSNRPKGGPSPIPASLNLYSVGFDATWEADLFGGTRRSIQEARANTEASVWARRDGEVTLTAEVANDYLALRGLQARIAVGEAELARQKDLFTLIGARRREGFVTNLDVNQQSTAVATAAAQIPQLQSQAKAEVHALGVLLGQPPEALETELAPSGALPPPPPTLPLGLPSQLLERRPDVREAERRLAASSAAIGVRTAALYPKLNLIGLGSFAGMDPGSLFSSQNLTSAAVGMLTQPVFDAGRNLAQLRQARETYVQNELAYRTTVLDALRDVEDALARFRADEDRRQSLAQSVTAATSSLKIAQDQYATGLAPFINVLQSEYALLNAEDQLRQADTAADSDLVAVYKALGGGWSP